MEADDGDGQSVRAPLAIAKAEAELIPARLQMGCPPEIGEPKKADRACEPQGGPRPQALWQKLKEGHRSGLPKAVEQPVVTPIIPGVPHAVCENQDELSVKGVKDLAPRTPTRLIPREPGGEVYFPSLHPQAPNTDISKGSQPRHELNDLSHSVLPEVRRPATVNNQVQGEPTFLRRKEGRNPDLFLSNSVSRCPFGND